jgi:hypothetical protein
MSSAQSHREKSDPGPKLLAGGNPQIPKLQFFKGRSLDPMPPKASKHAEVRYLDIREDDDLDEDQLRTWIKQAAALPGEMM